MAEKFFNKAVHSSGLVHLRAGTRHFHFASVGPKSGLATYSSRRDLAAREQARLTQWYSGIEVVPVEQITKAEYNALLKAGKRKVTVTFRGKVFTASRPADVAPYTHALGYFKPAHEVRIDVTPGSPAHERHPEGFYMLTHPERFGVWWYSSAERAEQEKARLSTDWNVAAHAYEVLEVLVAREV
jgi:hypothetical protein